jgi:hypothetical protein
MQCGPRVRHREVHLTFFPIAKNVRLVATHLYRNSHRGLQTVIVPGNPEEERRLAERGSQPRFGVARGDWKPWLWSRIPRGQLESIGTNTDDVEKGWPLYFRRIDAPSVDSPEPSGEPRPKRRPKRRVRNVLAMAQCNEFAFRPSPEVQCAIDAAKDAINWSPDRRVLGIHLRRGDAESREHVELTAYLAQADVICRRYGIDTIYLSTESEVEIERAKALRPQYQFLYLRHDREVFPKKEETDLFIETRAFQDPSIIEPIVESALVELFFLKTSDAFIGTFNSEFSMLAWLLCIGDKGHLMPYVNMTPTRTLTATRGNLSFVPSAFSSAIDVPQLLRQRLGTALETIDGQPMMQWPSLLRQRWKDRVRST